MYAHLDTLGQPWLSMGLSRNARLANRPGTRKQTESGKIPLRHEFRVNLLSSTAARHHGHFTD